MDHWTDHSFWREHREELLREAQERRLEREARKTRGAFATRGNVPARWRCDGASRKTRRRSQGSWT